MLFLVSLFGIMLTLIGGVFLVSPPMFRRSLNFWTDDRRIYLAPVLRIIVGTIFLIAGQHARVPIAVQAAGTLFFASGVMVSVLGPRRMRFLSDWWAKRPDWLVRGWSFLAMAFGVLIFYAATPAIPSP